MKDQILETIIGVFVLIIAAWFVFSVVTKSEDIFPYENEETYRASFHDISGIRVGSEIRVAGVTVGRVISISLNNDTFSADLVLALDSEIKLPDDSEAVITSEGLLGSNFISITPGGSEIYLKPNDEFIYTQGSINLNNLLQKFSGS
tara:strand:+ start:177 stop:617 length:441 start_codon:yes stop_codon:yes gene_type:complete